MEIEVAIKTALQYENRVVGVYQEAAKSTLDAAGKRMFETLVRDEQNHVKYLEHKLDEWKKTGRVTPERLDTLVPSPERIEEGVKKLHSRVATQSRENELKLLRRALDVEVETGAFYKSVVRELPPEGQKLFERFVEIEEGHLKIVQAEIDSVSGLGFWFDMQEFDLASG
ncbi:MAG: ferritin family protein [Candidatus Aminicenantes bacterium]|nr:ferritin family protein [Candidatus Aminicenantes bacterium]